MKVENHRDLAKLIALCRKQGVKSIKMAGIELELGDIPASPVKAAKSYTSARSIEDFLPGGIGPDTKILTDELSPEALLFYSADTPAEREELS